MDGDERGSPHDSVGEIIIIYRIRIELNWIYITINIYNICISYIIIID